MGYEYILETAYALPHLPADKFNEGVQYLTDIIDQANSPTGEMLAFGAYVRRQWSPIRDIVSVYKNPIRTNCGIENWHMHAINVVGGRENCWKSLGKH